MKKPRPIFIMGMYGNHKNPKNAHKIAQAAEDYIERKIGKEYNVLVYWNNKIEEPKFKILKNPNENTNAKTTVSKSSLQKKDNSRRNNRE